MNKNILIIGGMGPQASLLLHERLIKRAIKDGAKDNEDFPTITHLSFSPKDFINAGPARKNEFLETLLSYLYYLWRPAIHAHNHSL